MCFRLISQIVTNNKHLIFMHVCGGLGDLNAFMSAFILKKLPQKQRLPEQIPPLITPNAATSTPPTVIVPNYTHTRAAEPTQLFH